MKVVALCFLAAATFWLLNALNKDNYNTVVDLPIDIIYDKEEFMAVEKTPERIKIEINGNGWDLLRKYFNVNETPFVIEINNPATKDYILTSEIRRSLAESISPSTLISIVTDTIHFRIDKVVSRKIKVELDTTSNTLAENFRFAGLIAIDPTIINVKGPTSALEKLDGKIKIPLSEDRIKSNFNKIIPISVTSDLETFLTFEEESVQVKFDVVQFLEGNKRLKINKTNFPENVSLLQEPNNVMMFYLIDERNINGLQDVDYEAVLNYANRNKADSTIEVTVRPRPSILENIRLEPSVFRLKYD